MDYIGGVEGMNFTPITNYNNFLKNNMSFDVNSNMDFESILSVEEQAEKMARSEYPNLKNFETLYIKELLNR